MQRNRPRLIWAGALAAVLAIGGLAYLTFTAPTYACSSQWLAEPTPTPAPSSTPRLGFAQPDMGQAHVTPGTAVRYSTCPPASGSHYNQQGLGPITAKVYGPAERAVPEGWMHNLEHGALVLVYKCPGDACSDSGQAALKQLFGSWPDSPVCGVKPGVVGPVIARFDDMAYPYAALVWDQILPLQSLDTAQILAFYQQQAERTSPELDCAIPSPSPEASTTPVPPTAGPATPGPASAAPSQAPVSPAPSTSPAPAAS
ncbi:MAG TPA: DUF3105 domain-containing protein [Candidatus Limnocylindrales bacterium]